MLSARLGNAGFLERASAAAQEKARADLRANTLERDRLAALLEPTTSPVR